MARDGLERIRVFVDKVFLATAPDGTVIPFAATIVRLLLAVVYWKGDEDVPKEMDPPRIVPFAGVVPSLVVVTVPPMERVGIPLLGLAGVVTTGMGIRFPIRLSIPVLALLMEKS